MKSHRLTTEPQLASIAAGGPALKRNAKGRGVAMIQIVLRNLGIPMPRSFKGRAPDGDFGPETERAVKKFQSEHKLVSDGIVGKRTLTGLDELLVDQPCFDSADAAGFRANVRLNSIGPPTSRLVFYT